MNIPRQLAPCILGTLLACAGILPASGDLGAGVHHDAPYGDGYGNSGDTYIGYAPPDVTFVTS